jgi:hypothetical protein
MLSIGFAFAFWCCNAPALPPTANECPNRPSDTPDLPYQARSPRPGESRPDRAPSGSADSSSRRSGAGGSTGNPPVAPTVSLDLRQIGAATLAN